MRIVVVDTETTGMKDTDQVLELALVSWQYGPGGKVHNEDRWSALIRPTCPVSIGARAVHHISDEMLEDKWTFDEMMHQRGLPEINQLGDDQKFDDYTRDDVVFAAHNLAYDAKMIKQSLGGVDVLPEKRICTWQCAKHLYPDSEDGYSNQVLRYYLELKVPEITSLPPHRALPDAVVTAALLQHMLRSKTPEELIKLTTTPVNLALKKVKFGKYKGMFWKDLPSDYLDWIIRQGDFDEDGRHTARVVRSGRRQPLLQPRE